MLTEATDWIGGQLTSQAVPPDEHPWIERFGASASYRKLRHEIREGYRRHYPLTAEARSNERLNPGNGSVSALCHEPRGALAALTALLAPYASSGRLLMLLEHEAISSLPFQIPLGSLIPRRVENVLPACKNVGTTHITNGCYRLHPVEWGIGEAAGALAAFCLEQRVTPRAVRNTPKRLAAFQAWLVAQGVEIAWPRVTAR